MKWKVLTCSLAENQIGCGCTLMRTMFWGKQGIRQCVINEPIHSVSSITLWKSQKGCWSNSMMTFHCQVLGILWWCGLILFILERFLILQFTLLNAYCFNQTEVVNCHCGSYYFPVWYVVAASATYARACAYIHHETIVRRQNHRIFGNKSGTLVLSH